MEDKELVKMFNPILKMTETFFNIAYAVGVLSRFTSKPSRDHWLVIERVMRHLIGIKSYDLFYKKYPIVIEIFSNADGNTMSGDSLFTTSYIFTLGSCSICWESKRQTIINNISFRYWKGKLA